MKFLFPLLIIVISVFSGCGKDDGPAIETGTVTDVDGNIYPTVKIGSQWWMAENLSALHYRNGDSIQQIRADTSWTGLVSGAYCNYENDAGLGVLYGRLYNWYAVADSRNLAPEGWHVATDDEWLNLILYLGGEITAGDQLEKYGFNAFAGGYRNYLDGTFMGRDAFSCWWSGTAYDAQSAWNAITQTGEPWMGRESADKHAGYAVRCVKD